MHLASDEALESLAGDPRVEVGSVVEGQILHHERARDRRADRRVGHAEHHVGVAVVALELPREPGPEVQRPGQPAHPLDGHDRVGLDLARELGVVRGQHPQVVAGLAGERQPPQQAAQHGLVTPQPATERGGVEHGPHGQPPCPLWTGEPLTDVDARSAVRPEVSTGGAVLDDRLDRAIVGVRPFDEPALRSSLRPAMP